MKRLKHGLSHTKEYHVWIAMKARCLSEKCPAYKNYGGRGITICNEWLSDFRTFYEDMGHCPDGLQLDRIDNDLGYSKDNCKWVTKSTNMRNRRNNLKVIHNGSDTLIIDLSEQFKIPYDTLVARILKLGWSVEKAISTEVRSKDNLNCPNGHPYVDGSFYTLANGARRCKECQRIYDKKRRGKI